MTLADAIRIALVTSIFLLVLRIGLEATLRDATHLFRHPWQLVRSLAAMYVLMPTLAVALALAFDLQPAVKIALVAAAVSPVPPFLPNKAARLGGARDYTIGLLVAASVLAILFVPVAMELLERIFARPLAMSAVPVAKLVTLTVLAPLAVGMALRRYAPSIADRIAQPVWAASMALLAAGVLPVLLTAWQQIVSLVGNGTVVALAAFVAVGLVAGHLLGGHRIEERTVLALGSGSRHPGIAFAIAHANFPDDKSILPAVLLYLIVGAVAAVPYLQWIKRAASQPGASPP